MIVDALKDSTGNSILRDMPDDQMERMRNQANRIGTANLSRAADIAAEGLTQMRGATAPRLILELICGRILLPIGDNSEAGMLSRIERLERAENIAPLSTAAPQVKATTPAAAKVQEEKPVVKEKEAAPVVTTSIGMTWTPGSIGRPVPGIELRIVDENGDDVLLGDSGEIWIRGENIFAGYLNDPEATARVLTRDGWLRTGDIAVVDEDGHLYMVDRVKDLIIVSGFNVFPAEVEGVLSAHPDVAEVTVKTSTFDVKGLTILDFKLALKVDKYADTNDIEQVRMQGNFGMHESSYGRYYCSTDKKWT
mgnify:CR=1 FL=1